MSCYLQAKKCLKILKTLSFYRERERNPLNEFIKIYGMFN